MDVDGSLLRSSSQMRSSTFDPVLIGRFLIAFPVVGVFIWILAFASRSRGRREFMEKLLSSFLYRRYSSSQCVYNSLASLLLVDLLNGSASVAYGTGMIDYCLNPRLCDVPADVFLVSRNLSTILHLLAALVSVCHLCHPSQGYRYLFFEAAACLVIVVIVPTYVYAQHAHSMIVAVVVFALTLTVGFKSITPVSTASVRVKKTLIVLAAFITSLGVFLPSFVLECLIRYESRTDLYVTYLEALFYSSFNVIMDAFLCVLILSLSSEEQEAQQQPSPQWQQPSQRWQIPLPRWQPAPPQWQQPSPQWQQPSPQWQQPSGYSQQRSARCQQPSLQQQHRNDSENPGFYLS